MSFPKLASTLYYYPKRNRWQRGIGLHLPDAYKKFWKEWKLTEPTAVHYIKEEGKYKWSDHFGQPIPVQNVPLPLKYPKEIDEGIWGGEAVLQGFVKKSKYRLPTPKFWTPKLMKSVVYSEVLNNYMRTIVTTRTIDLIHENYGFDHYLLKTPACDLRSLLALKIKRNILISLADKTLYPDDPEKREEVYEKYKQYLSAYTREEIEWYGLSFVEAGAKHVAICEAQNIIQPLKIQYRAELIKKLNEQKQEEIEDSDENEIEHKKTETEQTWLSRMNPFSKSPKP